VTERYVYRGGQFINKETGKPMEVPKRVIAAPMIASDLPAYMSPMGSGMIEGRAARREDMKRHNVREVAPDEWKRQKPTKADLREQG
jgi:hypothetical protein